MEPNEDSDLQPDNEEFEAEPQTVSVAAPPQYVNGDRVVSNGNGHIPPALPGATRKVTVQYSGPDAGRQVAADLMGRVNSRPAYARDLERTKTDRDWLAAFYIKPDAPDYQLSATRVLPACNGEGEPIPTGIHSQHLMPVMFYDDLYNTLLEVWGGGQYRVSVVDAQGRTAREVDRCVLVDIPTNLHPAKREKFEKIVPASRNGKVTTEAPANQDDDAKKRKKDMEELVDNERREAKEFEIANARMQREMKMEEAKLRMEQMRRSMNLNPNEKSADLAAMEKRLEAERAERLERERKTEEERKERDRKYEEDRKETQRRYDDDKKEAQARADANMKAMLDQMAKMAEKISDVANRPSPVPDTSTRDMIMGLAPVLTALITKPPPPLPDNKEFFLELNRASAKASEQVIQLTSAMLQAPKTDPNAAPTALMMKMMENDKTGKDNLMANLITAIVSNKSELTPEVMMQLIGMGEKRADKTIEMFQGMQHPGGEGEDGYDPALGILGNAGKAIFSSLKGLVETAATNPAIQEMLMKFIGTRQPSQQQLVQAAWQMEQGRALPLMTPPYQPVDQQFIPAQPNPYQQPQQSAPQQRRGPAPLPPTQPQPGMAVNSQAQQAVVASELEGGSSGLPSNGDPEQQGPPPTPEELAEEDLCDAVTRTIEIVVAEAQNKPAKRTWPEDATDHWPEAFIKKIVNNYSDQERVIIIGQKCARPVAQQLNNILHTEPQELSIFWNELHRFVEINLAKMHSLAQPTPAPVSAQPPVQQVQQPVQEPPPAAPLKPVVNGTVTQ